MAKFFKRGGSAVAELPAPMDLVARQRALRQEYIDTVRRMAAKAVQGPLNGDDEADLIWAMERLNVAVEKFPPLVEALRREAALLAVCSPQQQQAAVQVYEDAGRKLGAAREAFVAAELAERAAAHALHCLTMTEGQLNALRARVPLMFAADVDAAIGPGVEQEHLPSTFGCILGG